MENNKEALQTSDKEVKDRLKDEMKKEKFRPFWTWYLYLICNVLVILGAAISWMVFQANPSTSEINRLLPTLVCNIFSLGGFVAFTVFEARDIKYKLFHTKKKWVYFIIASACVYIAIVIVTFVLASLPVINTIVNNIPIEIVV